MFLPRVWLRGDRRTGSNCSDGKWSGQSISQSHDWKLFWSPVKSVIKRKCWFLVPVFHDDVFVFFVYLGGLGDPFRMAWVTDDSAWAWGQLSSPTVYSPLPFSLPFLILVSVCLLGFLNSGCGWWAVGGLSARLVALVGLVFMGENSQAPSLSTLCLCAYKPVLKMQLREIK